MKNMMLKCQQLNNKEVTNMPENKENIRKKDLENVSGGYTDEEIYRMMEERRKQEEANKGLEIRNKLRP